MALLASGAVIARRLARGRACERSRNDGNADAIAGRKECSAIDLLKAVEGWSDLGFGDFQLRYLRDKQKREVDFLIPRDRTPWFLVEVKLGESSLSPSLGYFQEQTKAAHAFQVVMHLAYQEADCFRVARPVAVPARTLL